MTAPTRAEKQDGAPVDWRDNLRRLVAHFDRTDWADSGFGTYNHDLRCLLRKCAKTWS